MKLKRNYLTSLELNSIIIELSKRDFLLEREILKVALVAQILCEYDFSDYKDCDDIYDFVMESGIDFEIMVKNYWIIDATINKQFSFENTLNNFIKDIEPKLSNSIDNISKDLNKNDLQKQ